MHRAQDSVLIEHEGANQGDDVLTSVRWTVFEVKVEVEDDVWWIKKYIL